MDREARVLAARAQANRGKLWKAAKAFLNRLRILQLRLRECKGTYQLELRKLDRDFDNKIRELEQEVFRQKNELWNRHQCILFSIDQSIRFHGQFSAETLQALCANIDSNILEKDDGLFGDVAGGSIGIESSGEGSSDQCVIGATQQVAGVEAVQRNLGKLEQIRRVIGGSLPRLENPSDIRAPLEPPEDSDPRGSTSR